MKLSKTLAEYEKQTEALRKKNEAKFRSQADADKRDLLNHYNLLRDIEHKLNECKKIGWIIVFLLFVICLRLA